MGKTFPLFVAPEKIQTHDYKNGNRQRNAKQKQIERKTKQSSSSKVFNDL